MIFRQTLQARRAGETLGNQESSRERELILLVFSPAMDVKE